MNYEEYQIETWKKMKKDFVSFFQIYQSDISKIYDQVCQLQYIHLQPVIYTLAKIKKIIELCNYLEDQKKSGEDTDKLKIFLLTSHSEIAARLITNKNRSSKDLINSFFNLIKKESQLDSLIRGRVKEPFLILSAADTLYAIRNEYAHQGNFTSNVFQHENMAIHINIPSICSSKIKETDDKTTIINVECKIAYRKFLELYCRALQKLLTKYYKQKTAPSSVATNPTIIKLSTT
ncbi:MAG: hypothetical protein ACD_72C00418G0009 [uncultured bacterium]|nr:MAG: hypothetical protein ACD_72C00418G0009 [uncultured bacterium]